MRIFRPNHLTAVSTLAMAMLPALASAQCALCKQSLESGGGPGLIRGFFWSIILLISLPVVMSCAFGWALYRGAKRRRELIEARDGASPSDAPEEAPTPFPG